MNLTECGFISQDESPFKEELFPRNGFPNGIWGAFSVEGFNSIEKLADRHGSAQINMTKDAAIESTQKEMIGLDFPWDSRISRIPLISD
jgi:hypothetical protein